MRLGLGSYDLGLIGWNGPVGAADPNGISKTDATAIANNAAPSFSGLSFGAVGATRVMLAWLSYNDGAAGSAFTGCTIGGIAAAKIGEAAATGSVNSALYTALVPTGLTGTIVPAISNATGTLDCAVTVLRMVGFSATATDTAFGLTGGSSFTRNNDCPAGGVQVGCVYRDGTNGGGLVDWTNVDEFPEFLYDTNQRTSATAARVNASAQVNQAVIATNPGGGAVSFYMVVASFAVLP